MNKSRRIFSLILSLAFILSVCACAPKGSVIDLTYFNTAIHIETHDKVIDKNTQASIKNLLYDLENRFDVNNENSLTAEFNSSSKNASFDISDREYDIISTAKDCFNFSDGDFNPAVYPLIKLWQFNDYPTLNFTIPDSTAILDAIKLTDFNAVSLDTTSKKITKTKENVQIDFGGIVKGYAAEKVMNILTESGHTAGYVNVGGSSLALLKTDTLGIRHPRANSELPSIITVNTENVTNVNVSTSGDYQRYYEQDGTIYSHIISTKNGYPTNTGVISVTVIGADGAFSDAVTTAACLKTHNVENTENSELIKFLTKIIERYSSAQVYAIYLKDNVKQLITNKIESQDFTLHDKSYKIFKI